MKVSAPKNGFTIFLRKIDNPLLKFQNKAFIFRRNTVPEQSEGFTLIELIVVIALIAILSLMAVTFFSGTVATARDARRMADIDALSQSLEVYFLANKSYPAANYTGTDPTGNTVKYSGSTDPLTPWIPTLAGYLSPFPLDPLNTYSNGTLSGEAYFYLPGGTDCTKPSGFLLIAFMESNKYNQNNSTSFRTCTGTMENLMGALYFRTNQQ